MAVVRRNILLEPGARDGFIRGVNLLKQEMQGNSGLSSYDSFVVWHHQTMMRLTPANNGVGRNAAHRGPVFLPWHRYMLMALEVQLQRVLDDVDFGLPYWDWAADGDLPSPEQLGSALWGPNCMGGSGSPVSDGPFAFDANDANSFRVRVIGTSTGGLRRTDRGLRRALGGSQGVPTLPTTAQAEAAVQITPYDEPAWDANTQLFRNVLEGWVPPELAPHLHNRVHVWIGGDMGPSTSPNDPVFYLNHCNVDRLWSAWQRRHGLPYLPRTGTSGAPPGHRSDDRVVSIFPDPPRIRDLENVDEVYTYDTLAI
jgi:tyrosinase